MRVLVTGDRNYTNVQVIASALDGLDLDETVLITGMARGADYIAWVLGKYYEMMVEEYPADWDTHGRAAGPIRNQQMLDSGVDLCLVFHDDLANSKGTADMVRRCQKAGVYCKLYENGRTVEPL